MAPAIFPWAVANSHGTPVAAFLALGDALEFLRSQAADTGRSGQLLFEGHAVPFDSFETAHRHAYGAGPRTKQLGGYDGASQD